MGRNGDIFDFDFDTEKFKFYLKNRSKKVTYQDLVEILYKHGIESTEATVKKWLMTKEDNKTKPKPKYIKIICEELNIPFDEIIIQEVFEKNNNIFKIPTFEMPAGCGSMGEFDPNFKIVKEIDIPKIFIEQKYPNSKHLRIFKCFGDSMQPKYNSGDFVIVDMVDGRNIIRIDGIYVFRLDKAVYVKRLTFMPNKIIAKSINPDYESFEINKNEIENGDFEILGKTCGRIAFEDGLLLNNQGIC